MKHLPTLIALFTLSLTAAAQDVILIDLSPPVGPVELAHLEQVSLANVSGRELSGVVQMVLTDPSGAIVVANNSGQVKIATGQTLAPTDLWWNPLGGQNTSRQGRDFLRVGELASGAYTLCFSFENEQGERMGMTCSEKTASPATAFQLLYPLDGDTLRTPTPMFSWEMALGYVADPQRLSYELTITPMQPNQSAQAATERNVPVYTSDRLFSTSQVYPLGANALDAQRWYAWHVTVRDGADEVISSQAWRFLIAQAPLVQQKTKGKSYVMAATTLNNRFPGFSEAIHVGFNNNEDIVELSYSLMNLTDSDWRPEALPRLEPLSTGLNTFDIPTSELGLVEEHLYQLEFATPRGQRYYLQFKYLP